MKWKILTAILALLLVITNGWHIYHEVDSGVTQMYRERLLYEFANQLTSTAKLADACIEGKSRAEAILVLKKVLPNEKSYFKESALKTTWVSIRLSDADRVQRIEIDPTVSQWAKEEQL